MGSKRDIAVVKLCAQDRVGTIIVEDCYCRIFCLYFTSFHQQFEAASWGCLEEMLRRYLEISLIIRSRGRAADLEFLSTQAIVRSQEIL